MSGGGGGGGSHGYYNASGVLPTAVLTGGSGGNGGGSATAEAGGGGGGGFGATITTTTGGNLGTLSVNLTGGVGGNAGTGATTQGGGGGGGIGLYLSSSAETTLSTTSVISGGGGGSGSTGGVGGTAIVSFNTSSTPTMIILGAGASATGGAGGGGTSAVGLGGYGIYGSNAYVVLDATSAVSGGMNGNNTVRAAAIQFAENTANVLELSGNGNATGTSYATITGSVVGGGGTGTTGLVLGGLGGNFDLNNLGTSAQFQDFTSLTVNSAGTWTVSNALGSGAPNGWTIEAGKLEVASAAAVGTDTLNLKGGGTLKVTDDVTLSQAVVLAKVAGVGGGTFEVDPTKTLTLSGEISGEGDLTKTGDGTLALNGTNTYTGATTVSAGTLVIAGGASLSDSATLTVASGATLTLSNANETVGSLAGAGSVGLNSYTLTAGSDNTSTTYSGVMSGAGGLTKTGTGTMILTGTNTYTGTTTVSAGVLQIGDGGSTGSIAGDALASASLILNSSALNPGTFTIQSGGVLGGVGQIGNLVVNSGGIVAPGFSPGTITVSGAVQFNAGSTYQVDVTRAAAHDLIVAGGAVTLSNSAQVQVVTSPGEYAHLQRVVIVNTSGTITGTFNSAVTTDLPYLSGYLSYDANNAYLAVYDNRIRFADHTTTGNQTGVARAAQALGIGNSVFETVLMLPFDKMGTALNQFTGEAYSSTETVILDQSVYLRDAVGARLSQAAPAGSGNSALSYAVKAAGPATAKLSTDWTPTLWAQGYGGWGNSFSDGNAATISSSIGGFLIGLDTLVSDQATVGILGGFSRSNIDVTDRGSRGSIDNYDVGIYAGTKLGIVGLKGGVSYSWHDVSMDRTIAIPGAWGASAVPPGASTGIAVPGFWGTTSAGYTQGTTQVFGEVNTSFAVSSYEFEPFVGLAYVHLSSASTSEAAQTPAALAVDVSGMDTFYTTLGVRAATTLQVGGRSLTPSVTVGWQHAFNDVTPQSTMQFLNGTVPFTVEGVPVAENAAVLGAGLAYAISDKASLQVNYTGQIASSSANNGFTAQFALKF